MQKKYTWSKIPLESLSQKISRQYLTGQSLMMGNVYLQDGCLVPKHDHPSEQFSYVLKGALRFWVGDQVDSVREEDSILIEMGDVLTIPPNVPHRAVVVGDTVVMDVFSPPRQDWLDGTDGYLRQH